MIASMVCAAKFPSNSMPTFVGERSTRRATSASLVTDIVAEPSHVRYRRAPRRSPGTIMITIRATTSRMAATAIQLMPPDEVEDEEEEELELPDRLRAPSPDRVITRINSIWIRKPAKLSMAPIDAAPPPGTPAHSQNRTSSAMRAALLGTTSWMNWIAYWSINTGAYRIRFVVAPSVAKACANWTVGVSSSP